MKNLNKTLIKNPIIRHILCPYQMSYISLYHYQYILKGNLNIPPYPPHPRLPVNIGRFPGKISQIFFLFPAIDVASRENGRYIKNYPEVSAASRILMELSAHLACTARVLQPLTPACNPVNLVNKNLPLHRIEYQ